MTRAGCPRDSRQDAANSKELGSWSLRSFGDVSGLRTLLSLGDLELYLITFLKTFVAFRSNRAVVHEDIGAIVPSDEAVALSIVKPFTVPFRRSTYAPSGTFSFAEAVPLQLRQLCCHWREAVKGMRAQEKPLAMRVLAPL